MHSATDLSKDQIYRVFDMLDVDNSGLLDFDEFYLLVCILLAVRVGLCGIISQCHDIVSLSCLTVCDTMFLYYPRILIKERCLIRAWI